MPPSTSTPRNAFHGAKGTAADPHRRLGHSDRLDLRAYRRFRLQCLQRQQGRPAVLYPHLDPRVQRPRGIRFNTLSPGPIDTAMLDAQADKAQFAAAVPLNRLGRPEEIAAAALFERVHECCHDAFTASATRVADGDGTPCSTLAQATARCSATPLICR
jgi:Enoyl-(Acyl carrier protein) reductase